MGRPPVARFMNHQEFSFLAEQITATSERWLDRLHDLSAIDKPTLLKYASGERAISNTHALFLRQLYLLQKVYPDLSRDITILMRRPTNTGESLPDYDELGARVELKEEIKALKKRLADIEKLARG